MILGPASQQIAWDASDEPRLRNRTGNFLFLICSCFFQCIQSEADAKIGSNVARYSLLGLTDYIWKDATTYEVASLRVISSATDSSYM
mmetsp:Transcript_3870/g.11253  ORF Transcript_3870/g.11253 Transcript_3870/m.11253 type:complete len:88 (+) Transcript_3870:205-468(+)